ncbi:glycosyltransferase family protein [Gynurincola endophyticus]|uniref:glycosyltransferase family protein n=1 Tax=Gynurincola endophyticus TaxID=2479004 RepID=UPI000F8D7D50|nr:glycosyltransferase family protein [Gynurincola endophyticus]
MRILYAIQGTGNGHISRAFDIIPILQKKGNVDILISGTQCDIELPFEVNYRFRGLSFTFGKKGGVDLVDTLKKSNFRQLVREIRTVPVDEYDIVINDFEPVSAWACYLKNKPCIALSHQAAVMQPQSPKPSHKDIIGRAIMSKYAPATHHFGFHFKSYNDKIYTPVIRNQIRSLTPTNLGHYTVYLPAYSDERILQALSTCADIKWQVFSKHCKRAYTINNISFFPINNSAFIESMASSEGVLCGTGFETPAEALYLKKKLLVVPMKNQYEQHCNAAALQEMGIPVMKCLKEKNLKLLRTWVNSSTPISVNYPDKTEEIIDEVLTTMYNNQPAPIFTY